MVYENSQRSEDERNRPLSSSDWDTIAKFYVAGQTDLEIARAVTCSSKTIARWRWANDLPRNDRPNEATTLARAEIAKEVGL